MPTCFCKLLLRTRQVSMALKRRAAATHQQGDSARAEVAADGVLEDPRPRLLARIVRRRLCWLRPFVASRIFVHLSLPLSLSLSLSRGSLPPWLDFLVFALSCFGAGG